MKTLILGASTNPQRYSFLALNDLKKYGHEVYAIGGRKAQVGDVTIGTEPTIIEGIDTVTMYLRAARQESYSEYLLKLKPRRVVFNPGSENPKLAQQLRDNGIEVEEACTLVLLRTGQF